MNKLINTYCQNFKVINKIKDKKNNKLLPLRLFNILLIISIIQLFIWIGIHNLTNSIGETSSLFIAINTLLICGVFFNSSNKNIKQLHLWIGSNVINLTLLAFSVSFSFIPIIVQQMFLNYFGTSYSKLEKEIVDNLLKRNRLIEEEVLSDRKYIEYIILNKKRDETHSIIYEKIVKPYLIDKDNESNFSTLDNKFLKNKKTIEVF